MNRVVINGLGRSGTSWMLKVFDQHPKTFTSHEPEYLLPTALRRRVSALTESQTGAQTGAQTDKALSEQFIRDLFACRGLRAMRKRPIMRKSYRSDAAHMLRTACIYGLSAADTLVPGDLVTEKTFVPDLADLSEAIHVAKCVSFEFAMPRVLRDIQDSPDLGDVRFIYLLRHPCGQINSHMRGLNVGKMSHHYLPPRGEMGRLFEFDRPVEDLVEDDFTQLEINAYRWALSCDLNVRAAQAYPNAKVVRYEDLCNDPAGVFREVFDWIGLDWHANCARFIDASLNARADGSDYHALVRNPRVAANKWRDEMAPQDIETVRRICSRSGAAALYPDLKERAPAAAAQPALAGAASRGS